MPASETQPAVLHLCASAVWGGAEQVALTLRDLALAHGWEAAIDLPVPIPTERFAAPAPEPAPKVSWWRWAVRERRPVDVVHAHLPWPDRLGPALVAAQGMPLVVTFHLLPREEGWTRDRLFGVQTKWLMALVGRTRARVTWVALSREDARTLERLLGAPVVVVRNAPPRAIPSTRPVTWPEEIVRLVSVGRLEWQKGFERMIDALAHPPVRDLPWHWNLLGEGSLRDALRARITTAGLDERITLVGARPASDGLTGAHLLLAPSLREGMPLVPLEALEAGVPVIASRIPPHEELFEKVPDALLSADEGAWPTDLVRVIADGVVRQRLLLAQRRILGDDPRESTWRMYASLYDELRLTR